MNMRTIYRSAVTGHFISQEEAEANPDTSVKEQVNEHFQLKSNYFNLEVRNMIDSYMPSLTSEEASDMELLKSLLPGD